MSTEFSKNKVAIVSQGEDLNWFDTMPGEQMAIRVHSRDVAGAFSIIEARVPPFSGPPLHYHKDREEIFEVLEGRFRFHCAGEEFEAGPGTSVVVPRNSIHGWVNLGPGVARLLFTFVPGDMDEFFPQIGQTPPEGWADLAYQYDTWIVGEPLSISKDEPHSHRQ
ncbi:cupin domain-containing protein [Calothrix sp. FACHB-156]|nr:cupin domain-containing protein [Nostoc linckia FACHB-104]MBD2342031.1 cupin domain-containing protein [Calothrix sp. FACHB-156]